MADKFIEKNCTTRTVQNPYFEPGKHFEGGLQKTNVQNNRTALNISPWGLYARIGIHREMDAPSIIMPGTGAHTKPAIRTPYQDTTD